MKGAVVKVSKPPNTTREIRARKWLCFRTEINHRDLLEDYFSVSYEFWPDFRGSIRK